MLGNELFYLWIDICSLMHYEHNNYIQSKHKWRINYWAWIVQWFIIVGVWLCTMLGSVGRVWLMAVRMEGDYRWACWVMCEGRKVRDERERDWDRADMLWTLVYFLLRKFMLSMAVYYLNYLFISIHYISHFIYSITTIKLLLHPIASYTPISMYVSIYILFIYLNIYQNLLLK